MKAFSILFSCIIIALPMVSCRTASQKSDSVATANKINKEKAEQSQLDKDIAEFLVEIADGRMMDKREGEEALKKGTTKEIRQYGQLMVKDQTKLLKEVKKLAKSHQITLPASISSEKQEGLADLMKEQDKDFDRKFVKMIAIDHERDIKLFKKAGMYDDVSVRRFVVKYYPMLETHLGKVEAIKKNMQ
ncbi:DUF4142 domain-containing protein [Runella sp.]|uniref:DUF4142 domain-containing protein n=1 Tax=Runella sp. TaxID=1960881 RepID=UPI003D111116